VKTAFQRLAGLAQRASLALLFLYCSIGLSLADSEDFSHCGFEAGGFGLFGHGNLSDIVEHVVRQESYRSIIRFDDSDAFSCHARFFCDSFVENIFVSYFCENEYRHCFTTKEFSVNIPKFHPLGRWHKSMLGISSLSTTENGKTSCSGEQGLINSLKSGKFIIAWEMSIASANTVPKYMRDQVMGRCLPRIFIYESYSSFWNCLFFCKGKMMLDSFDENIGPQFDFGRLTVLSKGRAHEAGLTPVNISLNASHDYEGKRKLRDYPIRVLILTITLIALIGLGLVTLGESRGIWISYVGWGIICIGLPLAWLWAA
jgi:hypothetical protein